MDFLRQAVTRLTAEAEGPARRLTRANVINRILRRASIANTVADPAAALAAAAEAAAIFAAVSGESGGAPPGHKAPGNGAEAGDEEQDAHSAERRAVLEQLYARLHDAIAPQLTVHDMRLLLRLQLAGGAGDAGDGERADGDADGTVVPAAADVERMVVEREPMSPAGSRAVLAEVVLAAALVRVGLVEPLEAFVEAVGAALVAAEGRGDTPSWSHSDEPRLERQARGVLNRWLHESLRTGFAAWQAYLQQRHEKRGRILVSYQSICDSLNVPAIGIVPLTQAHTPPMNFSSTDSHRIPAAYSA